MDQQSKGTKRLLHTKKKEMHKQRTQEKNKVTWIKTASEHHKNRKTNVPEENGKKGLQKKLKQKKPKKI